ncbi:MAG: hypothetical protein FWH43_00960 [Endomicrobia bacterium]|nr:hypothetical protein [Endomicrobiia bacterium]
MYKNIYQFFKRYDYAFLTVLLGLIVFIIFCPVVNHNFVNIDDNILVYENDEIKYLNFDNLSNFFSKAYYNLYHPFVFISFALDYKITDSMNPHVFHATNFLFHIFNSLLVLLLIFLISENIFVSFLAAVLFAVHPMHVEPAAWVSERKEVLCTFFYLLSFIFYVLFKTKEKHKILFYVLAVIMFLCALFSKVMAVTLPLVLILYDYAFGSAASGNSPKEMSGIFEKKFYFRQITIKDKIIFFVIAIVFTVIAVIAAFHSVDGNFIIKLLKNIHRGLFHYAFYIVKLFFPFKLSILYPLQMENGLLYKILVPFFIFFWSWINIAAFKRSKKIFFGLMFYTVTVFPVLNIAPFGLENPADRFTYIPYIGLFYCAAAGVSLINSKKLKTFATAALCCIIFLFCLLSKERVGEWKNSITLFTKAIERYPMHAVYLNRAVAYFEAKEYSLAFEDIHEALRAKRYPFDKIQHTYFLRAKIYHSVGEHDRAIHELRYIFDNYKRVNFIFWQAAEIYEEQEKYHLAILEIEKLLKLEPRNAKVKEYRTKLLNKIADGDYPIPEDVM